MSIDRDTGAVLLLAASSSEEPKSHAETKAAELREEMDKKRDVPQTISSYVETPNPSPKTGNVDAWGGDLVGRWLSEKGALRISGWAVDEEAGMPARKVFLVHDGLIVAESVVNRSRPDVAEAWSNENLENSGWVLEIAGKMLPIGEARLEVYALMQSGMAVVKLGAKTIRMSPLCDRQPSWDPSIQRIIARRLRDDAAAGKWPKMNVDEAYIRNGELFVRGWALSPYGIRRVKIYVSDQFIGYCLYGTPRDDVARYYPWIPGSKRSGFALKTCYNVMEQSRTVTLTVLVQDGLDGNLVHATELRCIEEPTEIRAHAPHDDGVSKCT
jgi:hypothetical protein